MFAMLLFYCQDFKLAVINVLIIEVIVIQRITYIAIIRILSLFYVLLNLQRNVRVSNMGFNVYWRY